MILLCADLMVHSPARDGENPMWAARPPVVLYVYHHEPIYPLLISSSFLGLGIGRFMKVHMP